MNTAAKYKQYILPTTFSNNLEGIEKMEKFIEDQLVFNADAKFRTRKSKDGKSIKLYTYAQFSTENGCEIMHINRTLPANNININLTINKDGVITT